MSSYILECGVLVVLLYDDVQGGDLWMAQMLAEHLHVLEVFADGWNKDEVSSERQQRIVSTRGGREMGSIGRSTVSPERRSVFPSSVPLAHPAVTLVVRFVYSSSPVCGLCG